MALGPPPMPRIYSKPRQRSNNEIYELQQRSNNEIYELQQKILEQLTEINKKLNKEY